MTKLGRYEIIEKIGTGSMGTVSRARDTLLEREVALKTIRTGIDVEPELRERFIREAKACARLQHPGIVAVYDMGEADATAFISMELLVGSDLRMLIDPKVTPVDQRGNISLAKKLEAMITICQALAHAHRHGITHRDVKPSNLFLLKDGQAKVLDFGIARLPSSQLTVANKILGTPNYMAPEQILSKPTDARSDLFSAAVAFFEFLVYVHPFQSRLIPTRIVDTEPDSLFDHDSRMPILLEKVLLRGMAKNPDDRYRNGDEFAEDLKAVLDGVNHNASPSFSEAQLPSLRPPVVSPPSPVMDDPSLAPNPSLLKTAPPGEDEYEWRLSEVLRLIPDFEGAVERRDGASARKLFQELVTIQSVDPRFEEAVELCRTNLGKLGPATPVPASAASRTSAPVATPPNEPLPTAKFCSHCRTANRSAATACIKCGAPFAGAKPPSFQPPVAPPPMAPGPMMPSDLTIAETGAAASSMYAAPSSAVEGITRTVDFDQSIIGLPSYAPPVSSSASSGPSQSGAAGGSQTGQVLSGQAQTGQAIKPPPQGSAPKPESGKDLKKAGPVAPRTTPGPGLLARLTGQQKKAIGGGIGALVVILLAGVGFFYASRPVPVEPFVASVLVGASKSGLVKNPDEQSQFVELSAGQKLNILKFPGTAAQEWVPAQFVPGPRSASLPGFIRIADLDHRSWSTQNPEDLLGLIRMFHAVAPGGVAGPGEAEALQALIQQFPDSNAARDARADLIRMALTQLAGERDAPGSDVVVLRAKLDALVEQAKGAGDDPQLRSQLDQLKESLDKLEAAQVPPGKVVPPKATGKPVTPPVGVAQKGKLQPGQAVIQTPQSGPAPGKMSTAQMEANLSRAEALIKDNAAAYDKQVSNARLAQQLVQSVLDADPSHKAARDLLARIQKVQSLL